MARYDAAAQTARHDRARVVARWDVRNRHPLTHHNHNHNNNQENTMSNEPTITIVGNLTADPEMRFTQSGAAVASFTIASTPRTFDRQSNQWKDGETLFMRCSLWREAAENVAESLTKGTRVIAQGRLVQRSYTTREGENRTVVEMQVDEIGPSLRYAKAVVTRTGQAGNAPQRSQEASGGAYGGGQHAGQGQQFPQPQTGAQAADPWGGQQTSVTF